MTITERVKLHLKAKDITMEELGSRLGVSKQSISKTLNKDDIKVSTLSRISKAIGVRTKDFFEDVLELV